jgi:hypothetical protein
MPGKAIDIQIWYVDTEEDGDDIANIISLTGISVVYSISY